MISYFYLYQLTVYDELFKNGIENNKKKHFTVQLKTYKL